MNWKHIWHTVRKDIHAQRFHLAVWAALTLVSVGILAQPELDLANGPIALMIVSRLLPGVLIVYGIGIGVVLLHSDPVAGTSAFWMTRPVRPASLFAAKAIEIGGLVAVWFLADFLVLAGNGAVSHAPFLAFEFAIGFIPWLLIVLAIAALVPNTPRFLLAIGLAAVGFALLSIAIKFVGGWFFEPVRSSQYSRLPPLGERLSAQIVAATIASVGAIAVIARQFLTRRTRSSVIAGSVAAAAALLAANGWSHNFMSPADPPASEARFDSVNVQIDASDLRSGTVSVGRSDGAEPIEYRTVSSSISVEGLPDGVFGTLEALQTNVISPDGTEFPQVPSQDSSPSSDPSIRHALDGATFGFDRSREHWESIVRTGEEEFRKFAGQTCKLRGEAQVELYRHVLVGELPLEVGASLNHDGVEVRITGLPPTPPEGPGADLPGEYTVRLSEKFPYSKLKSVMERSEDGFRESKLLYFLFNREKGQAMRANGSGSSTMGGLRMIFQRTDRHFDFSPAYRGSDIERTITLDQDWIAGATVAILKRESLGEITREVSLDGLHIEPLD